MKVSFREGFGQPRKSKSHLQGILELNGFKGFPTGGNMMSGYSDEAAFTAPEWEVKQSQIMPKLSNGRKWTHHGPLPQQREDVFPKYNSMSKNFLKIARFIDF